MLGFGYWFCCLVGWCYAGFVACVVRLFGLVACGFWCLFLVVLMSLLDLMICVA